MDSYEVGRFPSMWSEWNGRFRDTVRDWWRSQDGRLAEFASRLCGSSDIYGDRARGAARAHRSTSSPCTTGSRSTTLSPMTSKHNEANTENNRDGTDDNRSWNCGVEGPTDDPDVLALRARQKRAFLLTLLLVRRGPDAAGWRRAGPHPKGQQQRLLPGQRDHLV